jgi:RNA polymerase sigma-70 factor (ECF subfamily)
MATVKDWRAVFARVKAALMHRGCTRDDADDLAQEAYLKLICYELEHTVVKPDAFLMRTALNLAIDAYRVQRNRGELVLLEELTLAELARADPSPTVEATLLAKERLARLAESLMDVGVRTRAIYLAHRMDGMTYQEIAQRHGLSVSAVEKHVAKATMAVMQWMEGW